jgi:hypothetical protein
LVLIGPVLLKLVSTGYRMVRYYSGSRSYRVKVPPALPLRSDTASEQQSISAP